MNYKSVSIFLLLASTSLYASPGFAQEQTSDDNQAGDYRNAELVVTARKQAETLISVPVAVTAMSAMEVNRYAATDLVRIAQLNPQVELFKGGSGAGATFLIRGIGSSAADPGLEQTVSVNIDGVQVSRGRIIDQGMFDLQQVEILKGPQALFFGKNSPAGVISLTSNNPTDRLEGFVKGGYEFVANERFLEAAISGPITDTLKVRLAGRASKMDGWIRNVATPRPDPFNPSVIMPGAWSRKNPASKGISGRLTVLFEPTSNFTSTLKVMAGTRRENADTNFEVICADGIQHPVTQGIVDTQSDCKLNRKRASTAFSPTYMVNTINPDGVPFSKQTNILASWTNELDLGALSLTSVTGFMKLDKVGRDDSSTSSIGNSGGGADELTKAFTQEIRASSDFSGPLNFTVGAYYDHVKRDQYVELTLTRNPLDPVTGLYLSSIKEGRAKNTTLSVFGQLRYDITEELELAGGIRWTREKKRANQRNAYARAAFRQPDNPILSRYSDENVSPEATLTWRPDGNTTVFAAYKTGYKSGGIANPVIVTNADTADSVIFGAEKVEGGEIGYKARLFDRRVRLELVAYRYTFKGLQSSSFDNQLLRYVLRNAGSARTTGLEGSLDWSVTDEFSLRGAFGYNRAKFVDFSAAPCYAGQAALGPDGGCVNGTQDLTGRQLYRAPKFSFSAGASYDRGIGDALMIGLNADTRYTSGYIAQENYNPLSRQKGYWLLNAGARLYAEDDQWELAFIGRNLTNENYIGYSIDRPAGSPGEIAVVGTRAREFMLQGTFRF